MCRRARPRAPDGSNIVTNRRALGKRPYDVLHSFNDRKKAAPTFSILNSSACIKKDGQWPSLLFVKATPHKACAEDAPTDFFVRLYRNSAGILSYVKGFLCKMTENMSTDSVQSRQAGFVRCCLYSASPYIRIAFSMIAHSRRFFSSSHEIL